MRTTRITAAIVTGCAAATLLLPTAQAAPPGTPATGVVDSVQPLAPAATLPGSVNSVRITYSSTGAGDVPTQTSAAVYFPPGQAPEGGWPVIAWAHGTVGLGDDCAYSIAGPGAVQRDWAYLGTWLDQGYAIVAADYAGLGGPGEHPYLNGVVEAHNVVDAVKAATRRFDMLSNKWVVVGQSQGGGAAVFTARYATEFGGPELDYRGAVGTGVPAYIEDILLPLGPGMPPIELSAHSTAYVLYILNGLRTTYPELDIESFLTQAGLDWLARARQACIVAFGDELSANNVVVGDLFARPLSQIPNLHGLLRGYMGLPESGYDKPLFLGQGLRDTDVITPQTLRFAATLAAAGEPVTLRTYPTGHDGAVNDSLPDSLPFVRDLFA
ncbi:alpha/beta hydrolase family protein [Nocardia cyriacigeorgica]|uniref:alpha/beta hydrolase family protein n=1 Tax=Nocardia cyriacigeorgica TaxID=135487 RepID=UPI001892F2B6|nr:lipase family protein [Nocardia cyriacigeorgica]MBF6412524.1 lipase [Nocardia cyriacigeorgica]